MTHAEWLTCDDSPPMLLHLRGASDRKLRLFALACWRRVWPLLSDPLDRAAVEVAEGFVEGAEPPEAMDAGWTPTAGPYVGPNRIVADAPRSIVPCRDDARWVADHSAENSMALAMTFARDREAALREEGLGQAELVRDIFGNPFRPVAVDPAWLTPTVVGLAGAIYEERAFDRLPVLADALMEAGCQADEVLAHCRSPGPHVRGCWVVDLVLGKE